MENSNSRSSNIKIINHSLVNKSNLLLKINRTNTSKSVIVPKRLSRCKNGIACMDEPKKKKKKSKKWTETKPKKIMHANGTDSVANREALRHWKGRGREERNKIRRNNEGAF